MHDSYNVNDAERRLEAVLRYLSKLSDSELNRWFVESLAEGLAVKVIPLPDNPLDEADELADRWISAVWLAGWDDSLRAPACRRAVGKIRGLMEVLDEWMEEAER